MRNRLQIRNLPSNPALRWTLFLFFLGSITLSVFQIPSIRFSYDFEQFFPQGDEDYLFFKEFVAEFESDDNFLLIALPNAPSIYDSVFLQKTDKFTHACQSKHKVNKALSLTNLKIPLKTPFGMTAIKVLNAENPLGYSGDSLSISRDKRIQGKLVNAKNDALLVYLKTEDGLQLEDSKILMAQLEEELDRQEIDKYHFLGRANFQVELVKMQKEELIKSTLLAAFLMIILLFLIYRHWIIVGVALTAILLSFILFLGYLTLTGKELNAMAALYPIIMIIVGSSDVIHLYTKYIGEIHAGQNKMGALTATIKEIGVATFLTSVTTAIGFSSLMASKITALRDFGLNSAVGVLLAFFVVVLFMSLVLPLIPTKVYKGAGQNFNRWEPTLTRLYIFGKKRSGLILKLTILVFLFSIVGTSLVSTDYSIEENMPRDSKVTEDFIFFDTQFNGFRPFEVAIFAKKDDFNAFNNVVAVNKLENHIAANYGITSAESIAGIYKSIHQAYHSNDPEFYRMPENQSTFTGYQKWVEAFRNQGANVLLNKAGNKTRISAQLKDIGADSIQKMQAELDAWIQTNLDTSSLAFRQTGTGLMIDKNAEYVREDLIAGLGLAIGIVGLLMAFLFKNFWLWVIALIPNLIPLLLSAAVLGFTGTELEASISIAFAVVFGIAVDDSIHFLSKFRLVYGRSGHLEYAILRTFKESGKAIVLTTIILFFGFLTLLFSKHPPSQTIGFLIGTTLVSAMLADLFVLPILLRKLLKRKSR